MSQLDQMTQQNAALVEESAAAASSLSDQASRLEQAVSVFKVGEHARTAPAPRAAAPQPAPAVSARPSVPKAARSVAPPKVAPARLPPAKPARAQAAGKEDGWESF